MSKGIYFKQEVAYEFYQEIWPTGVQMKSYNARF